MLSACVLNHAGRPAVAVTQQVLLCAANPGPIRHPMLAEAIAQALGCGTSAAAYPKRDTAAPRLTSCLVCCCVCADAQAGVEPHLGCAESVLQRCGLPQQPGSRHVCRGLAASGAAPRQDMLTLPCGGGVSVALRLRKAGCVETTAQLPGCSCPKFGLR